MPRSVGRAVRNRSEAEVPHRDTLGQGPWPTRGLGISGPMTRKARLLVLFVAAVAAVFPAASWAQDTPRSYALWSQGGPATTIRAFMSFSCEPGSPASSCFSVPAGDWGAVPLTVYAPGQGVLRFAAPVRRVQPAWHPPTGGTYAMGPSASASPSSDPSIWYVSLIRPVESGETLEFTANYAEGQPHSALFRIKVILPPAPPAAVTIEPYLSASGSFHGQRNRRRACRRAKRKGRTLPPCRGTRRSGS